MATNRFRTIHSTIKWFSDKVTEFEKEHNDLIAQNTLLEERVMHFQKDHDALMGENKDLKEQLKVQNATLQEKAKEHDNFMAELQDMKEQVKVLNETLQEKVEELKDHDNLKAESNELKEQVRVHNQTLQEKLEELEKATNCMDYMQEENEQLQNLVNDLQCSRTVEPTHRNILYSEEENQKRLPVHIAPWRGARVVGGLVFGECFAVAGQQTDGQDQDVWLQIQGGDYTGQWVLGRDAGMVNCVDMTKYDCEMYRTRIQSIEHRGQNFPKRMYTEGFLGAGHSNICLISASRDSLWREVNIEMLLRGIAAATVYEADWGSDETFADWVAYYAANCVQYGQLRTPLQKHLKVTVKPTSRWREYQAGCCLGPNLDEVQHDIGKAQYKECCWLKGMKDELRVKWEEVEFVTAFDFLRAHCAWSRDDCREAANERFLWVLHEFFSGGYHEEALYELECAHWLWDEAFHGCTFNEAMRTRACADLQLLAKLGARFAIPRGLHVASAAPLAWELVAGALTSATFCLSAGGTHSLALGARGKLRPWGGNSKKQCFVPTLGPGERWAVVSAGYYHSLGLTAAGVLHTWGSNSYGQCSAPALAKGDCWVAMSAGDSHNLGLTAAGTLHAWGRNDSGQCTVPVLRTGDAWAMVSAGNDHSLAITVAGVLHAWGYDRSGQCSRAPLLPRGERWASVSAGGAHSLGLTVAGTLHAWGDNDYHQCSDFPVLDYGEHWVAVSAGGYHSLGLTSRGALHVWGRAEHGQKNIPKGERWLAVSAGGAHSVGITASGALRSWGADSFGQVSGTP